MEAASPHYLGESLGDLPAWMQTSEAGAHSGWHSMAQMLPLQPQMALVIRIG